METWKTIQGFDHYEVSDAGNVRRKLGYQCRTERPNLWCRTSNSGYFQVSLCLNSEKHPIYVHRLVAQEFIGPLGRLTVNHKNGQKKDNRAENLEIISQSENNKHSYRVLGKKGSNCILTEECVSGIIADLLSGMHVNDIASKYVTSKQTVSKIKRGTHWKQIGNAADRTFLASMGRNRKGNHSTTSPSPGPVTVDPTTSPVISASE